VIANITIAGRPLSRIVFGCEPLGGMDWGKTDTAASTAAVDKAIELGITAFDVADVYGLGRAETLLGQTLSSRKSDVLVMTKGGVRWWQSGTTRARTAADGSAAYLRQAVEASLGRLGMDSIPLYFLHRPDPQIPIDESIGALAELVREGSIGAIGLSNVGIAEVRRAHAVHPIAAVQFEFSLLRRGAEVDLIPGCRELGIAALAHGPLAQGLLTGRYDPESTFDIDDRRHRLPLFEELGKGHLDEGLRRLKAVASRHRASPAQVAIKWALDRAGIAAVIAGAKNTDQVSDNAGSLQLRLDDQDQELLGFAAGRVEQS
jgi:aryl-alcohol dehydrogenase-like predicted oxidoreductase